MTDRELTARWESDEGRALAGEALAKLVAGRGLDGLGFGMHEGRVDLRGLRAPEPGERRRFKTGRFLVKELSDTPTLRKAAWSGLDVSGSQLASFRFHGCSITDCRFDRADCRDWRLWDTTVERSSFARANLREAAVGTWHNRRRNTWRGVDFSGADFRVGPSWAALYEDCNFTLAKLVTTQFEQCQLVRCRFSGPISRVLFDGREIPDRPAAPPMQDVDFSDAVFNQVEFRGCDLSGITLPDDPDVRLVHRYPCVLERALAALGTDQSVEARMLRAEFENSLRGLRGADADSVYNRRDYANDGEALAVLAERVIGEADAFCSPGT